MDGVLLSLAIWVRICKAFKIDRKDKLKAEKCPLPNASRKYSQTLFTPNIFVPPKYFSFYPYYLLLVDLTDYSFLTQWPRFPVNTYSDFYAVEPNYNFVT